MEPLSQCVICRHQTGTLADGTPFCLAFPDGIPPDVQHNRIGHTRPLTELGQAAGNTTIFDPTVPKAGEPGSEEAPIEDFAKGEGGSI